MKESVKIDAKIVSKMRKAAKSGRHTIGGLFEWAAMRMLEPSFNIRDSLEIREFLDAKKIHYTFGEIGTSVQGVLIVKSSDAFDIGKEFGQCIQYRMSKENEPYAAPPPIIK